MPDPTIVGTSRRRFREGLAEDYWFTRHPPQPGMLVIKHSDHTPSSVLFRTSFYRRFLQPNGYHFGLSLVFWRGSEMSACVTLLRRFTDGDFLPEHVECLAQLHRSVLCEVIRRLQEHYLLSEECFALRAAWNLGQDAQAVVRSDGKVIAATRKGLRTLSAWGGSNMHKPDRQQLTLPSDLRKCCQSKSPRNFHHHPQWKAEVVRLSGEERRESSYSLIRFTDAAVAQRKLIPSRITATEAEILRHVAQGKSNAEIALVRGTARATVKNQLSTLLAKFGVRSRLHLALGYRDMLDDAEPAKRRRIG